MKKPLLPAVAYALACCLGVVGWNSAQAQPGTEIDFVTVGSPNNPAYRGPDPFNRVTGRGSVPYEYRIGRTEVTTLQWLEFYNTFSARADRPPAGTLSLPIDWGAERDPTYPGPGVRYRLKSIPNAGDMPAFSVTWRTAARFVNWLCNDKSSDLSAIANGAYDTSTFGPGTVPGTFTDQATHSPGARFWIPTLDEWMKAVHWSPNNPNLDGWYLSPNGTDNPLTYGVPGMGDANAGFNLPNFGEYRTIPLGAYAHTVSPWGLIDASGANAEWLDGIRTVNDQFFRMTMGSHAGSGVDAARSGDSPHGMGGGDPGSIAGIWGLRVASSIPGPSVAAFAGIAMLWRCRRARTRDVFHATAINAMKRCGVRR